MTKSLQVGNGKQIQVSINRKKLQLGSAIRSKIQSSTHSGRGWVLLADTSGSMGGEKIIALRETLQELVSKYTQARLAQFQSNNVSEIYHDDVSNLQAAGSTPMYKALELAYMMEADSIILLTDGYPDEREDKIEELASLHSQIPINPIGIGREGQAFNEKFLKRLAAITGGQYQNVGDEELHLLTSSIEKVLQIEHKTIKL